MKTSLFALLSALLILVALPSCEKDKDETTNPDAPQIETLSLQDDNLLIKGKFGEDPGAADRAVHVDGEALPEGYIRSWTPGEIICKMDQTPTEDITVEVYVKDVKSAPKVLHVASSIKIDYLQMREETGQLYIYGKFGPDPGPSVRSVKVKNVPVQQVVAWSPTLIICKIPAVVEGSYGEVVVSTGPNQSTSRILYRWDVRLKYSFPQGGQGGSLYEAAEFHVPIRGDIIPPPAGVIAYQRGAAYPYSYVDYDAGGSGHSAYDNGCNTVDVVWQDVFGTVGLSPDTSDLSGSTYFHGWLTHQPNGYDLELEFDAWEAIPSTVTFSSCFGFSSTENQKQMIDFVTFDHKIIPLRFNGKKLEGGELVQHNVASTAGLIWDASDYPANLVDVKLVWNAVEPKK